MEITEMSQTTKCSHATSVCFRSQMTNMIGFTNIKFAKTLLQKFKHLWKYTINWTLLVSEILQSCRYSTLSSMHFRLIGFSSTLTNLWHFNNFFSSLQQYKYLITHQVMFQTAFFQFKKKLANNITLSTSSCFLSSISFIFAYTKGLVTKTDELSITHLQ